MLKKKLLGMVILLLGVMLVFAVIGCNDDDSKDKLKDDGSKSGSDSGIGAITSLSVKTKGIKSLYAGNVAVTGNSIGRAIVNGNGDVLTLSHIDENGNNSPVVFTSPSGKQYMLEIVGMEKIDNTRIIVGYIGIYEVTTGEDGKIVVGTKEARDLRGALIDMKSGRVYEFEAVKIWNNPNNSVNMFGHRMWFIENNICYFADGWPDSTVYKIDLTAASPQKVPLSNGAFVRIDEARPAFTIDGRIIGMRWDNDGGWKLYIVETNGTGWKTVEKPDYADGGGFLLTIPKGTSGIDYDVTLYNSTPCSLIMKDLSGNTWLYTIVIQDEEEKKCHAVLWSWGRKYLITQLHVDNTGKFEASNISTGDIVFEAKHDEYWYDNYGDAKMDYLPFYINDVGIALSFLESPNGDNDHRKPEAFLHNGVYLLNTKGFIKITKKQDGNGIEQTSVALNIPKVTRKTAVISKDGYLYWVEGNVGVKRLKLESGAVQETIYNNSNVIADTNTNAPRDYLTVSGGGDTLIFYMSSVGSKVYTYALDLKDPKHSSPIILAENDIEIKAVAELSF